MRTEGVTDSFNCPVGLKQCVMASTILFVVFLNDLVKMYEESGARGIQLSLDIVEVLCLLFADDLALASDSAFGLQRQLNILKTFCDNMLVNVNIDKTKSMVFKQGGCLSRHERWTYDGHILEVVNNFPYVGSTFTSQLSFSRMASDQATKAKRVVYF